MSATTVAKKSVAAPAAPTARTLDRDRVENAVLQVLRWVTLVVLFVLCVFPFYYMALLSVRLIQDVQLSPGSLSPGGIRLGSYREVLRSVANGGQGFLRFIGVSSMVAVATVIVTLVVSVPGAYAVTRLRFAGRRQVDALFLAVYLFPPIVLAIPLFVLFSRLGLRGSLVGLALVYVAQTVPVTLYMLRGYFETIPVSLEEAAQLDGCGRLGVIWRVSLPLSRPALAATSLYVFMIAWNEYLFALLFLVERRDRWTVSLGLSQLANTMVEIPTTVLMAGSVLLTVPIVALFFAGERLLVEGLTGGAEKG